MRKLSRSLVIITAALSVLLASCIFEKPVYPIASSVKSEWEGLWTTQAADGTKEQAALIPAGGHRWLLQYPVTADGWYFDAQSVRVRGRDLLQLKVLAESKAKIPASDSARFTLLWIDSQQGGSLGVRALDGNAIKAAGLTPKSLRKFLASPDSDWNQVFGKPLVFTKK